MAQIELNKTIRRRWVSRVLSSVPEAEWALLIFVVKVGLVLPPVELVELVRRQKLLISPENSEEASEFEARQFSFVLVHKNLLTPPHEFGQLVSFVEKNHP